MRRTALTAAVLTAAVSLAACGEQTIDNAELEDQLKQQLGADAGVEPRSVECPEDIVAEEGRKFDCILTAPNGDEVTVNVTLTNDQGGFEAEVPPQQ